MAIRILTKNGVDNTNIDGARDHNFNAGRRSGIVKGALNNGNFFASNNNTIALDTCELRLCGHRIVLENIEYRTFTNKPSVPVRYSFVARVIVDDNDNVSFEFVVKEATTKLVQDNLDVTGSGTYELEIGKFTQLTDGNITDVVRTADLITGGADNDSDYIRIGTVTTNKIDPQLDADVDIENTINPDDNKPQTNFTFNLPTAVGTVVSLNGEEQVSMNTDLTPTANSTNLVISGGVHDYPAVAFAESERQKSKNLLSVKSNDNYVSIANDGLITINYTLLADDPDYAFDILKSNVYLKKGHTYTFSIQNYTNISGVGRQLITCGARKVSDNTYIGDYLYISQNETTKTITPTEDLYLVTCFFYGYYPNESATANFSCYLQIEENSVATDYQPYNGEIVREEELNEKISTYSMIPSSNKITNIYDFTTTGYYNYTAPANGYVTVFINLGTATPADLWLQNQTVGIEIIFPRINNTSVYVPCKKGDTITFYTSEALTSQYNSSKFIYAED